MKFSSELLATTVAVVAGVKKAGVSLDSCFVEELVVEIFRFP